MVRRLSDMQSMEQLVGVLRFLGRFTFRIHLGDGAQLLVLPHGGRALGLFTSIDAPNFLWTNPDFTHPVAAGKVYASEWPNVGGDRTWLSPEAEFFIRDIKNPMQSHRVPIELDPGSYVVETTGANPHLVMTRHLHLLQSRISISVRIIKWFTPARPACNSIIAQKRRLRRLQHFRKHRTTRGDRSPLGSVLALEFIAVAARRTGVGFNLPPYRSQGYVRPDPAE